MREIKFRAWDSENLRMVTNLFVVSNEGKVFLEYHGGGYTKPHYLLMQYTGLKDKNGKEIYEGDVLSGHFDFGHGKWKMTCEVFYDHSGFRMKVLTGDERRDSMVNYCDFIERDGSIFEAKEIIGNIYENPELLNPTS